MWHDRLKELGVNIHVIATGAGTNIQHELWTVPGSSAYLSGASFPYAAEEQADLLGFMPEQFCSPEAAVDLASAAYMKAYKLGGKKPVGLGLTASVASEKLHRGDHRAFACVMTDDKVWLVHKFLEKGTGECKRQLDNTACNDLAFFLLIDSLDVAFTHSDDTAYEDATELAKTQFFKRPFFTANGKRMKEIPSNGGARVECSYAPYAMMSGAFNPPHEGHLGVADHVLRDYGKVVVFETTANPPHKESLSVQQMLQRAKLLQGYDRIFTSSAPYYLDKARAFPGMPLVLGADAMLRMLDPKWGLDPKAVLQEFVRHHTKLYVSGRMVDGKFVDREIIEQSLSADQAFLFHYLSYGVDGRWDISSTELRARV